MGTPGAEAAAHCHGGSKSMSTRKRIFAKCADIAHSPGDSGWWVELWRQAPDGKFTEIAVPDSPKFATEAKAEPWARKQGSTVLVRVG
jgi:hypothetical protein